MGRSYHSLAFPFPSAFAFAFAVAVLSLLSGSHAQLGAYHVNPKWVHTSGISAGAYMSVQFSLAFSSSVHGSGSIAGGPYFCAEGNVNTALTSCMSIPSLINVNVLVKQAESYALTGQVDPLENLQNHKNYIFAGKSDGTVNPLASEKLQEFWLNFQNSSMISAEYGLNAGHAHITDFFGNSCTSSRSPYINNCNYDSSGILLQHLYGGSLKPRGEYIPDNLFEFNQSGDYGATSLQRTGYVYVPTGCQKGELCGLHIAFHGCQMNSNQIGDDYVANSGYNQWGESNNIIILYPQADTSVFPSNPNACFDWWGYAGADYATKTGVQMKAVKAMMDQLMSGGPTISPPSGLTATSISNNSVTLYWNASSEADGYIVYRNGAQVTPSAISSNTFTDAGLASGTTYQYTVASFVTGGLVSTPSQPISVKTTGPPPPLTASSLSLSGTTSSTVSLSWTTVSGAEGYVVLRNGGEVARPTSTSFTDTGLQPETSYTYIVRAFNSGSVGPDSNAIVATTGSSWVCQSYYDNNYNHVSDKRAYQKLGYVYANGSDELMGLYNIATYTRLAETSSGYFVIGQCP